jgi:hypothetical protein
MSLVCESKLRHDYDDDDDDDAFNNDPLATTTTKQQPNGLYRWPVNTPFITEQSHSLPSHHVVLQRATGRPVPNQLLTRLFLAVTIILVVAITVQRRHMVTSSVNTSSERQVPSAPPVGSGDDDSGDCASSSSAAMKMVVVTKFVLWDATTNERLDDPEQHARVQLTDNAALCAGDLPAKINIEAVVVHVPAAAAAAAASLCANTTTNTTTTTTAVVVMDLLGTPPRHRTEYTPPYLLAGQNRGRVFPMNLPVGPYALSAMVYPDNLPSRLEIAFRVFDC